MVTPHGEHGKVTGEPKLSVHICGGINGISQLADPQPPLIQAAYLAAFHTEAVQDRVLELMRTAPATPEFKALRTDDARTDYLRALVGPQVVETHELRDAICKTIERFEIDTGVVVTDCSPPVRDE